MARWGKLWLAVLLVAALIAVAFAAQDAAWRAIENLPVDWGRTLRRQLLFWPAWALPIPAIAWLTDRAPVEPHRPLRRLPAWLGLGVTVAALHSSVYMTAGHYLHWLTPPPPPAVPRLWFGIWVTFTGNLAGNLLYFALIAAAFHAARYYKESRDRAAQAAALEARLATAELDVLRMQLHPHFFFNTLNTVSALMEKEPEAARGVLAKLADLLRLSLEGVEQEVPLQRELDLLGRYVDIQQARFGERLRVVVDADPGATAGLVPSLLLQPLVENAIRHGLEPRRAALTVTITARAADGRLRVEVTDDGPGSAAPSPSRGAGVGLANTRSRLRQLYGDAHAFHAGDRPGGGFRVAIDIPLVEPSAP